MCVSFTAENPGALRTKSAASVNRRDRMNVLIIALPLQLFVTLDAKIHAELKVGEAFLIRSVGSVAAQAVNRKVLIPRINRLLPDRVRRMFREVMAVAAQLDDRLVQQQDRVGCVRRMAGVAHPCLHGIVLGHGLFLPRDRILVTVAAQLRHRGLIQETLPLGSMRAMTVHTPPLIDDRPVDPVHRECRIDHLVVASATEFKSGLLGL